MSEDEIRQIVKKWCELGDEYEEAKDKIEGLLKKIQEKIDVMVEESLE